MNRSWNSFFSFLGMISISNLLFWFTNIRFCWNNRIRLTWALTFCIIPYSLKVRINSVFVSNPAREIYSNVCADGIDMIQWTIMIFYIFYYLSRRRTICLCTLGCFCDSLTARWFHQLFSLSSAYIKRSLVRENRRRHLNYLHYILTVCIYSNDKKKTWETTPSRLVWNEEGKRKETRKTMIILQVHHRQRDSMMRWALQICNLRFVSSCSQCWCNCVRIIVRRYERDESSEKGNYWDSKYLIVWRRCILYVLQLVHDTRQMQLEFGWDREELFRIGLKICWFFVL